jgi:hypothetical protein
VLGAAAHGRGRRGVVSELAAAVRGKGLYAGSGEELTPWRGDPLSLVPILSTVIATLVRPEAAAAIAAHTVANYALSPEGWDQIQAHVQRVR